MPRLPYTAIRALLRNARKVASKPSAASRRKLLQQVRELETQFQKAKPVEVPEGFPITRPTREQARFSAMQTRKRLYETSNLDPEVFQHDYQTGVQGLTGRALTAKQLREIKGAITPEFAAKIKDVNFPDVGPISLARLENLLGKRTTSMQPFFGRGGKQDITLRAGRRERLDYARKTALGDSTFDPTTGRPKAGSAAIFKGAQELGASLEVREASARQTAALMRSFGDETRSIDELTKMMLGSIESGAGSRTGGLE